MTSTSMTYLTESLICIALVLLFDGHDAIGFVVALAVLVAQHFELRRPR